MSDNGRLLDAGRLGEEESGKRLVKRPSTLTADSLNCALRLYGTPRRIVTQKPWAENEQDHDSGSGEQHLETETRCWREHVNLRRVPNRDFHERSCLLTDE